MLASILRASATADRDSTISDGDDARLVIRLSDRPAARKSLDGSPLVLRRGSTATTGVPGAVGAPGRQTVRSAPVTAAVSSAAATDQRRQFERRCRDNDPVDVSPVMASSAVTTSVAVAGRFSGSRASSRPISASNAGGIIAVEDDTLGASPASFADASDAASCPGNG